MVTEDLTKDQLIKYTDNDLLKALQTIAIWFKREKIPYMIFGGIANSIYGNPRQTFDIDVKISLDPQAWLDRFVEKFKHIGKIIPEKPVQFIQDTHVLPVDVANVRINIFCVSLPFEIDAIRSSQEIDYLDIKIQVCTVEDLTIHKAVSTRQKDWIDIEALIFEQNTNIDWQYLLKKCEKLSDFLNQPEIIQNIRRLKDEAWISGISEENDSVQSMGKPE